MAPRILDQLNFSGRRVLVTGGGRGIGRAIVEAFVELRASVFVLEKDASLLVELKKELPTVVGIQMDVTDRDGTAKAIKSILPIHHLVNNAGVMGLGEAIKVEPKEFDQTFDVNFKAALYVSQIVSQGMIAAKVENGTIVNLTSIIDSSAYERTFTYSCTAAALAMQTKMLAVELGPSGIRVNYVRPGVVATAMCAAFPEDFSENIVKPLCLARSVLPRSPVLTPEEVAPTVVFLSSTLSGMVTGTGVLVDGGHGARS